MFHAPETRPKKLFRPFNRMSGEGQGFAFRLIRNGPECLEVGSCSHFHVVHAFVRQTDHSLAPLLWTRDSDSDPMHRLYRAFPLHPLHVRFRLKDLARALDFWTDQFAITNRGTPVLDIAKIAAHIPYARDPGRDENRHRQLS